MANDSHYQQDLALPQRDHVEGRHSHKTTYAIQSPEPSSNKSARVE